MHASLTPQPTAIPDGLRALLGPFVSDPIFDRAFSNPWDHPPLPGLSGVLRWKSQPNRLRPPGYKPRALALPPDPLALFDDLSSSAARLLWIGHASFLCELDGVRIAIDPIFGRAGGFVPRVTPAAVGPEQLDPLHAVLITHGHHDHLDPGSLRQLAKPTRGAPVFVVPRGLGSALPKVCRPLVELSWWQHVRIGDVRIHLVPAQHWHRRGFFDENRALWGGFVLEGTHTIYHSGDTGYFGGFRAVGEVFGGLDVACLPLGAYEPAWFMGAQHMSPPEALQAFFDLRASHFVGMHWGAFDLSDEPLDAGARWLLDAAPQRGLSPERVHVLSPGGSLGLRGQRGASRALVPLRYQAPG